MRFSGLIALSALVLLAGCGPRPTGDFGRAAPSTLHDAAMPMAGTALASARGEPVSNIARADIETEMVDRVWRFLVAPHAQDWAYDTVAELQRTRITPLGSRAYQPNRYGEWLLRTHYQSSTVRYATLERHVLADLDTLPTTFAAICAVIELDGQRAAAARSLSSTSTAQAANVAARRMENEQVIQRFVEVLDYRYRSYDLALDRLLIETPHADSVTADAALRQLEPWVVRGRSWQFCARGGSFHPGGGQATIPSRYSNWANGSDFVDIK